MSVRLLVLDKKAPLADITFDDVIVNGTERRHVVLAVGPKAAKAFPELAVDMVLGKVAGKSGGWVQVDAPADALCKWLEKNVGRPMELRFNPPPKPEEPRPPRHYAHLRLRNVRQQPDSYRSLSWMNSMARGTPIRVTHNGETTTYTPQPDFGPYISLRRPLAANGYRSPGSPRFPSPRSPDFFSSALSALEELEQLDISPGGTGVTAVIRQAMRPEVRHGRRRRQLDGAAGRLQQASQALLEAAHNGQLLRLRVALNAGADPNTRQRCGARWTACMAAARGGHRDCVGALVVAGANVNSIAGGGATAMHLAAAHGRSETVVALLRAGGDPEAVLEAPGGLRPRDLAARGGAAETAALLDLFESEQKGLAPAATATLLSTAGWTSVGGAASQLHDLSKRRAGLARLKDDRTRAGAQAYAIFRGEISLAAAAADMADARASADSAAAEQRSKDARLAKEEADAQEAAAGWYEAHFLDPDGMRAAAGVLDNAVQNCKAATAMVSSLYAMFEAWAVADRSINLPVPLLDELLHQIDPVWLPGTAGLQQAAPWLVTVGGAENTRLSFEQMLHLYIGSEVNLPAIDSKLIKPWTDTTTRAGIQMAQKVIAGAAAAMRLADPTRRGLVGRFEFEAMARAVGRHANMQGGGAQKKKKKKAKAADAFGLKAKELDELWKQLIGKNRGGELDAKGLLEALRPTGRLRRKVVLYNQLVFLILLPAGVAAVLEQAEAGQRDQAVKPGQWMRAAVAGPYRASPMLDADVLGNLGVGDTVQVLETQELKTVAGWLRVRAEGGWLSLNSASYPRPLLAMCDAPWQVSRRD